MRPKDGGARRGERFRPDPLLPNGAPIRPREMKREGGVGEGGKHSGIFKPDPGGSLPSREAPTSPSRELNDPTRPLSLTPGKPPSGTGRSSSFLATQARSTTEPQLQAPCTPTSPGSLSTARFCGQTRCAVQAETKQRR